MLKKFNDRQRRALFVGINAYPVRPLRGCVRDARQIGALLRDHEDGTPNFRVESRFLPSVGMEESTPVRESELGSALDWLFEDAPPPLRLFYYSGHGVVADGIGAYLQTSEGAPAGVAMSKLVERVNTCGNESTVLILDCCHAGAAANARGKDGKRVELFRELAELRHGVSILAAARTTQQAIDTPQGGVFALALQAGLRGGAADVFGRVSVASLFAHACDLLDDEPQQPTLKAHLSTMEILRGCKPRVKSEELCELPTIVKWKQNKQGMIPMDPSWDPEAVRWCKANGVRTPDQHRPEKFELFKRLKRFQVAGLLSARNTARDLQYRRPDLFWASVWRGGAFLTPLGIDYCATAGRGLFGSVPSVEELRSKLGLEASSQSPPASVATTATKARSAKSAATTAGTGEKKAPSTTTKRRSSTGQSRSKTRR